MSKIIKSIYEPNKVFWGLYVILLGDFIQIEVFSNTSIYKSIYVSTEKIDVEYRYLMSQFNVFYIEE